MEGQSILNRAAAAVMMNPTRFSTGSVGYRGQGKVVGDNGKRYQVQVIATEIGSKPKK